MTKGECITIRRVSGCFLTEDCRQKNGAENAEQTAPVDVTDLENRTRANRGPDERTCDGETDAGSDDSEPQETASPTGPDCPSISQ